MTEEMGAEKGSWDDFSADDNKGGNNGNGDGEQRRARYMQFKEARDYRIRLVGSHVKFRRHWQPFPKGTRVITHSSYRDDDPAWAAGFWPKETFAIHVIDRDDGQLKILEKGKQIFGAFAEYKRINDIDPAGKEAPDFVIKVERPNPKDVRNTTYTVVATAKATPLTEEEYKMAKDEAWPLPQMYKSTPLDKIKEAWENIPEDQRIPPKRKSDAESQASAKSESKPADPPADESVTEPAAGGDDDLFSGGSSEGGDSSDLF